ncbi:MAG: hypothetical protein FWD48_05825 [Oscillospiraceae bacterium]|nr:hypothetical protein [Oscillospiraceae bacterium]
MKLKIIAVLVLMMLLTACAGENEIENGGAQRTAHPTDETEPDVGDAVPSVPIEAPEPPITTTTPIITTTPPPEPEEEPQPEPVYVKLYSNYPLFSDKSELLNLYGDIANAVEIIKKFGLVWCWEDVANISPFNFIYFDDEVSFTWEETLAYNEEHDLQGYYYFRKDVIDRIYKEIFSKNATNVIHSYDGFRYVNDNLLTRGPSELFRNEYFVIRDIKEHDESLEIFVSILSNVPTHEDNIMITDYYNWEFAIEVDGFIDENTEVFITLEMLDNMRIIKYTFILEDGKYKILSIENVM